MILKASQRGGAGRLATHLLNANDNEHVEIYEVSGFMSGSLKEALHEAWALSRGTKCKQFLFSVSLSPPQEEYVPVAVFEDAARRIEERLGLMGQPRVLLFHEKQGRRHAHAVWSRIDTEKMRAINLPFFKNRLMEISKELYLEHGWKLPNGLIDREQRNPLNFTLKEWQQAKRLEDSPQQIKSTLKECWAVTKDKEAFARALEHKGYYLARGDRRGYVAVDWRGEVYSLSRWLDVKTKDLKARLADPQALLGVEETKAAIDMKLAKQLQDIVATARERHRSRLAPLLSYSETLQDRHDKAREQLRKAQKERWNKETHERQARLRTGLFGLLDRLTGKHARIMQRNELETYEAATRDRTERDALIHEQLGERIRLQTGIRHLEELREKDVREVKGLILSKAPVETVRHTLAHQEAHTVDQDHGMSMEL